VRRSWALISAVAYVAACDSLYPRSDGNLQAVPAIQIPTDPTVCPDGGIGVPLRADDAFAIDMVVDVTMPRLDSTVRASAVLLAPTDAGFNDAPVILALGRPDGGSSYEGTVTLHAPGSGAWNVQVDAVGQRLFQSVCIPSPAVSLTTTSLPDSFAPDGPVRTFCVQSNAASGTVDLRATGARLVGDSSVKLKADVACDGSPRPRGTVSSANFSAALFAPSSTLTASLRNTSATSTPLAATIGSPVQLLLATPAVLPAAGEVFAIQVLATRSGSAVQGVPLHIATVPPVAVLQPDVATDSNGLATFHLQAPTGATQDVLVTGGGASLNVLISR